MKSALVCGGGGFIGGHMAKTLKKRGYHVISVDIKPLTKWELPNLSIRSSINLDGVDLRHPNSLIGLRGFDEVYNFACDMGGMGFIETHKADCMLSVLINTNILKHFKDIGETPKYFYASSACVYPDYRQDQVDNPALAEDMAYPAMPEDGYGWEKLFSERMCRHFMEDYGFDIRIARFHNVYGPHTAWQGGREKAPAAICRKVIEAKRSGSNSIDIWGDGEQTRSFMYIEDCIEGVTRLMQSNYREPLNIGSSELVTVNHLVTLAEAIGKVKLQRNYQLDKPKGVRGRNSDNTRINEVLSWEPRVSLSSGLLKTYKWIEGEMNGSI